MAGSALLEALMGSQYKAAENPWGIMASGIGAAAPMLASPYQSVGKNIGYTAGASLLAGILGGLAQDERDRDNLRLMDAFNKGYTDPQARSEIAREQPRLASVFNAMKVEDMQREAEMQQKRQEQEDALNMEIRKAQQLGPIQTAEAIAKERALLPLKGQGKMAELKAETDYWNSQNGGAATGAGMPHPNSPQYKVAQDQFDNATALRKNFEGLDEVQKYKISAIGFKSLVKAAEDPSSTSDLELVRGAIQAIEPGMAVREGEQAAVAASAAIPDWMKASLNKALTGGTGLPANVRDGVLRIAARRFDEYSRSLASTRDTYVGIAQRNRINPEDAITIGAPESAAQVWPGYEKSLAEAQNAGPPPGLSFAEFQEWKAAHPNWRAQR